MSDDNTTTSFTDMRAEFCRMLGMDPNTPPPKPLTPEEQQARTRAMIREQRMEWFRRFCPREFLEKIDRNQLRNATAWDTADKWRGTFPGLWLWSHATGEAKTRFLWHKFGELHVNSGRSVLRVTGLNLAEDYADARQGGQTFRFYDRFGRIDIVMLDDLDKMDLPGEGLSLGERDRAMRNARMLRELFDTFYEEHTPVLVTANEPIAWFGERIGASAERRMRECCAEIEF